MACQRARDRDCWVLLPRSIRLSSWLSLENIKLCFVVLTSYRSRNIRMFSGWLGNHYAKGWNHNGVCWSKWYRHRKSDLSTPGVSPWWALPQARSTVHLTFEQISYFVASINILTRYLKYYLTKRLAIFLSFSFLHFFNLRSAVCICRMPRVENLVSTDSDFSCWA